ncbi:MAG: hypothetical protein AB1486_20545 [Planctomycetota bacterium]
MRVALVGPGDREEIRRLAIRLEERGGEALILDSRCHPEIRLAKGTETACGQDLSGLRAVYVADLGIPKPFVKGPDGSLDLAASALALAASRRHLVVWNTLLARLAAQCAVVNPPHTHDLHALKPWEIATYHRLDLPAPVTLATSAPVSLTRPHLRAIAAWIRKGLVGGHGYTEAFELPQTVEKGESLFAGGPLMIQERIEGDNVRAFVLDGTVIGAAEVLQAGGETDSRRGEARIRRITLPDEAARLAVAAARHWGLLFTAVDFMRVTRSGSYFILECNSAPFFVNFEKLTGIEISARLAEYLLRGQRAVAR